MLADVRRFEILAAINQERVVRVADLADKFGVSLMTVRRDIEVLEEAGKVEKSTAVPNCPETPAHTSPDLSSSPSSSQRKSKPSPRRL